MRASINLDERGRVLLLVVGAALIRFINLGSDVFWYDEAFTAWIARLSLSQLAGAVRGDVHPPIFYFLEWVIAHLFGSTEFTLRFLSAVFGVVAVLLAYWLAKVLGFSRRAQFFAAGCVLLLPGALYYSQEARAYSLLSCAALLLVIGAIERRWWLVFFGALGCAYLHNLGLFYALAIGGVCLISAVRERRGLRGPLLAFGGAALLWLPWGVTLLDQLRNIEGGFWIPQQSPFSFLQLILLATSSRTTQILQTAQVPLALALSGLALLVARDQFRGRKGAILAAALFLAPGSALAASIAYKPVFIARPFLASIFIVAMLWVYAASKMKRRNQQVYSGGITLLLLFSVGGHFFPPAQRSSAQVVANIVRAGWQNGDIIYFQSPTAQISFGYYLDGLPQAIDPRANDLNQMLSPSTKIAFGFNQQTWPPADARRAWIVVWHTWTTSARELAFQDMIERSATLKFREGGEGAEAIIWLADLTDPAAAQ